MVSLGRESIWVFFGRPDASSDFTQIVDLLMLYRSTWVSGAESIKLIICLAEEGSEIDDFSTENVG